MSPLANLDIDFEKFTPSFGPQAGDPALAGEFASMMQDHALVPSLHSIGGPSMIASAAAMQSDAMANLTQPLPDMQGWSHVKRMEFFMERNRETTMVQTNMQLSLSAAQGVRKGTETVMNNK